MNETEALRSHVTHPRSRLMEGQHEEAKSHCLSLSPVVFTCDCASESPRWLFQGDTDWSHSQVSYSAGQRWGWSFSFYQVLQGRHAAGLRAILREALNTTASGKSKALTPPYSAPWTRSNLTHTRRRFSCLFVSSSLRKRWFFSLHHCLRANGNTRCQTPPVQSWLVSN